MTMDFLVLKWDKAHRLVHNLASKIEKSGIKLDLIVAIARGGLTPGHMLSDFLQLPLATYSASSYKDFVKQSSPHVTFKISGDMAGKNVLLVDEISDSGSTFIHGISYMKEHNIANVYTAAIYIREHTTHIPDFYVKKANSWIVFPWDTRETIENLASRWTKEGMKKEDVEQKLRNLKLPQKYIKKYLYA
jgi:hypoxanthine phosphoribosyltransferase